VRIFCKAIVVIGLITAAAPSYATLTLFTGTRGNVDAPGASAPRCGSMTTGNIRNDPPIATSSGLSNFGAFTPTLSHCIQLPLSSSAPTPFTLGEFLFAFASGDTLIGTYSGSVTAVGPGMFSIFQTHLVTGGTGLFTGATGSFDSSGSLSFLTGRPVVAQNFSGFLNLTAVPEPSTWLTMLLGFAAVGGVTRSRRAKLKGSLAQAL